MSNIIQIDEKYYDFGTKNQSFLTTARELKSLGIKNWYFMLEVRYPHLGVQDIDPLNPNISSEDIGKIHIESKANVWFWMREVARIPVRGAPKPMLLELTRASCAAIWCFDHSLNFQLCQPRQTYKTTVCMLICEYAFIYEYHNVEIPFMHRDGSRCQQNGSMFKSYVEILPKYMNPWSKMNKAPGVKSLRYAEHGVSISIVASADSDEKAMDMLRGITMFMMLADEWEFIPHISKLLAGASPAIQSARSIAKQSGIRCCIMYLSTPGDLDTQSGKEAQRIIDNTPTFTESMYDFSEQDLNDFFEGKSTLDDNGQPTPVTTVYIEFDYKQLRKDEKYLRAQYAEALQKNELSEYRRGTLLQRFRGSGAELFDKKGLDYIVNHVRQPNHEILILKKFILYCYDHEVFVTDQTSATPYFDINTPYLIGIDIAAGGNGDNTAICVLNPYTLEVAAELMSPFIGQFDLFRIITQLAILIPRGIFCPETNNIGKALVDFAQETQIEDRFYHDPKLDISKNAITLENTMDSLKERARMRGYIGTYVTSTVRNNMFDLLKNNVKDYYHLINTKYLVSEVNSLIRFKNGKIAAENGAHDDMVMAYLHTIYVLNYGYDLNRFGIDKSLCKYEKKFKVLEDYEKELDNKTINNLIPTEGGENSYENMVLRDIMNSPSLASSSGDDEIVDRYGYSYSDYTRSLRQEQKDVVSMSDIAFFNDCNNNFMDGGSGNTYIGF